MKKRLLIVLLAFAVSSGFVFARSVGIGPEFGYIGTYTQGALLGISVKVKKPNLVFTVVGNAGSKSGGVGLAVDYWFYNPLVKNFNSDKSVRFYAGIGGWTTYNFSSAENTSNSMDFLVRFPLGFNFFTNKNRIEPFVQFAPAIGVNYTTKTTTTSSSSGSSRQLLPAPSPSSSSNPSASSGGAAAPPVKPTPGPLPLPLPQPGPPPPPPGGSSAQPPQPPTAPQKQETATTVRFGWVLPISVGVRFWF